MNTISARELKDALQNGAVVIDVREPAEFSLGHIDGVRNIPLSVLAPADIPNGAILMCASGGRSGSVVHALVQSGAQALNVEGGIIAWVEAGYPIVR